MQTWIYLYYTHIYLCIYVYVEELARKCKSQTDLTCVRYIQFALIPPYLLCGVHTQFTSKEKLIWLIYHGTIDFEFSMIARTFTYKQIYIYIHIDLCVRIRICWITHINSWGWSSRWFVIHTTFAVYKWDGVGGVELENIL